MYYFRILLLTIFFIVQKWVYCQNPWYVSFTNERDFWSQNPELDGDANALLPVWFKKDIVVQNQNIKAVPGMLNYGLLRFSPQGKLMNHIVLSMDLNAMPTTNQPLIYPYGMDSIQINSLLGVKYVNGLMTYNDSTRKYYGHITIEKDFKTTHSNNPNDKFINWKPGELNLTKDLVLNVYTKNKVNAFSLQRKIDTNRVILKEYSGYWPMQFTYLHKNRIYFIGTFLNKYGYDPKDSFFIDSGYPTMKVHRTDSNDIVIFCMDTMGEPIYFKKLALSGVQGFYPDDKYFPNIGDDGNIYLHGAYLGEMEWKGKKYINSTLNRRHLFYASVDTNGDLRWVRATEPYLNSVGGFQDEIKTMDFNPQTQDWDVIAHAYDVSVEQYRNLTSPNTPFYLYKLDRNGNIRQIQILFDGYAPSVSWVAIRKGKILHPCKMPFTWRDSFYNYGAILYVYYDTVTGWVKNDPLPPLSSNKINIYPNPAQDYIYIEGKENEPLRIYDLQGRIMHNSNSSGPLQIPVHSWPVGMYILQSGSRTGKVMVVR